MTKPEVVKAKAIFCSGKSHDAENPIDVIVYKDGTVRLQGKRTYRRGALVLHRTQVADLISLVKKPRAKKK